MGKGGGSGKRGGKSGGKGGKGGNKGGGGGLADLFGGKGGKGGGRASNLPGTNSRPLGGGRGKHSPRSR